MGFLRFLLIILVVSVIFRIVFKWLIPMFFRSYVGKMAGKMKDSAASAKSQTDSREEGEVIIENQNKKQNDGEASKRGEYIEYEEVD